MFQLTHVALDYGRMKENPRTRLTENRHPVVSWGALSDRPGAHQAACRLQIGAWDSGWVACEKQEMSYAGDELPAGQAMPLMLQIQDDAGIRSEIFRTEIYFVSVAWHADWIASAQDLRRRTVYFRREFCVREKIRSACLYAAGLGYAKAYINGSPVDAAELDPAHTDMSKTVQYAVYPEIEHFLQPGTNCLGAILGEGWRRNILVESDPDYFGPNGRKVTFGGMPAFSAMLQIVYESGQVEWLVTDNTWQSGRGAHRENDLFDGEIYDANDSVPGWCLPSFSGFAGVRVCDAPGGSMRPMVLPPIGRFTHYRCLAAWPTGEDSFIADFGQNLAGIVEIRLPHLRKGQVIRIAHAEELTEDGRLYRAPLRKAKAEDTYIASGDEHDLAVFAPMFTYHGFRYAEISGLGAAYDPECLCAIALHTDLDTRSFFRCGNALATRIHEICVETERGNQHSILTDCPNRDERQGWMNDATVRFEETPYNFDVGRMFTKIVRDIRDSQTADGAICCTAPFVFGNNPADPVCSSYLMAALENCLHTGNLADISEGYEGFRAWTEYLLGRCENGIVPYSYYGDWAGPVYACKEENGVDTPLSAQTPGIFMSTGYGYFNCMTMARFAAWLGKTEDAEHYRRQAEEIRQAMLQKWYDPKTAKMATGSQGCQAFALWLNLLPETDAPRAAKVLCEDLIARGYRFTTGNLCSRYLLDELTKYGYGEEAWNLVTREEYPSIGYMIQQEATTVWERFELKKDPGMNSHNHPMYAAMDSWFYAYIAGIQPLAPGYQEVSIHPYLPRRLMSAQAVVDTVRGDLSVRWFKRYGEATLLINVPFGVHATVEFGGKTQRVDSGFHRFAYKIPE